MPLQTTTSFPSRGRSRSRPDLTIIESDMHGMASVPTAPVQIPASRRPAPSILVSNNGHSGIGLTPDAVFDMSPVTSEFGSSPSPSSQTDRSKFLYSFPSLPRHQPFAGPRRVPSRYGAQSPSPPNPSEDRSIEVASRYRASDPLAPRQASRSPYLCKGSNVLDEYDLSPGGMSPDSYSPMKENHRGQLPQALPFQRTLRSQTSLGSIARPTLSPGPRQPLGETSPWLFPGRGMHEDRDDGSSSGKGSKKSSQDEATSCSYSHVDPGVFEYKNHLLKRLESRYPSRLNMGPCMQ